MPSQDEQIHDFHAKGQSQVESIAERDRVAHHATLLSESTGVASQRETSHVADSRLLRRGDICVEENRKFKPSLSAVLSAGFRELTECSGGSELFRALAFDVPFLQRGSFRT